MNQFSSAPQRLRMSIIVTATIFALTALAITIPRTLHGDNGNGNAFGENKDYPFNKFLEDWGGQRSIGAFEITRSRSCGSGVVITVDFQKGQEENLWVQNADRTIGFSPFAAGCPAVR